MNKSVVIGVSAFVLILVVLLILVVSGFFSTSNKKDNPIIDLTNYGSVQNLSDTITKSNTLAIFKENYKKEYYEREFTNPFEEIQSNALTQIIIDNIKKITGKEPYLCLNKDNDKLSRLGLYRPIVYLNIHLAIIKPIMNLLQQNPPQLYDAASIMLPYFNIQNQQSYPNLYRNMEIIYDKDNVTVKHIRIMKIKMTSDYKTQLDSDEPMSVYEFIGYSLTSDGIKDGKFEFEKTEYVNLVEEKIINPLIELCIKTYDEIPGPPNTYMILQNLSSYDKEAADVERAKLKAKGKYDIDLATFTKCIFMRTLRYFNLYYILNNCCDSEDKSTCEQDALRKV